MTLLIHYRSSGEVAVQSILFLHGGGVAGWMWDPVVARLADYHCLVADLPEHGASMEVRPFSMQLAAEQAVELIRARAHDSKAVVVGLSEGAQVVVQMLSTQPEGIMKAVVSSALLLPMPASGWLSSAWLLAWTYRLSVPPFRKSDWWMRLNMKYAAAIPESAFPQYQANFQQMTESQFVNLILANQHFRMPKNLSQVAVPTLVLAGKREYAVMKESARQLATALPNAQARLVDLGKGTSLAKEHNWAMNAPDLFAATLRAFTTGQELPKGLTPLE
jgi:pimeloyl-ACP methyl ester carboxylesterase